MDFVKLETRHKQKLVHFTILQHVDVVETHDLQMKIKLFPGTKTQN